MPRAVCVLAVLSVFTIPSSHAGSAGCVVGAAVNGTTNELQLIVSDLGSYEVTPLGPPQPGFESLGQAAIVSGSTFWTCLLNTSGGATLAGFDLDSGAMIASLATHDWPGVAGGDAWIENAFLQPPGLLLVGYAARAKQQLLWSLNLSSMDVALLGTINTSAAPAGCGDFGDAAYDPSTSRLFLTCAASFDDPAGNVVLVVDAAPGPDAGSVTASFSVPDHFDFAQVWAACRW